MKKFLLLFLLLSFVLTQNPKCEVYEKYDYKYKKCYKVCDNTQYWNEESKVCEVCANGEIYNPETKLCELNNDTPIDDTPIENTLLMIHLLMINALKDK